ncbi:N-acetylglucosamine-6-phosphate deacetylase [Marinicrinis lubricantis]|uniref:N-acetylglucosamine-6-phosphate deacetylase n=1 Tax=Marinicrinis lubricantis TaxID=2086470 RepID=UPI0039EEEFE7
MEHVHIVLENEVVTQGAVQVQDGRITQVAEAAPADHGHVLDGQGGWLLPGFIDLHVHGGGGHDFMDASQKAYDTITAFHAQHGTTTMLATTVTAPQDAIEQVLHTAAEKKNSPIGAKLAGVHLEGPFISPKWPGAQNPSYIVPPRMDWMERWVSQYPGLIRMLTLAPETEGALPMIRWLAEREIIAACGHTDASYEQIFAAVQHGLSHAVHTFNAMKGLHHREPGTVGAVLESDHMYTELIADGFHVHPGAIRLLTKAKPKDRVILITDAISAAGLGDGEYALGGLPVVLRDGEARLKNGGSLAGSTLTMDGAVRFMLQHSGLSIVDISRMASLNPACRIGIEHETGSIASGKIADLVLMDAEYQVRQVWIEGRPAISTSK